MSLNEKISIEEIMDEMWEDYCDEQWVKYIAGLCKDCGAERGEHTCEVVIDE